MKFLFIFAHPDDETIGTAGTIVRLKKAGHHIKVISATDGSNGEVSQAALPSLAKFGTLGQLRRHELAQACQLLGADEFEVLDFEDGHITNVDVWGKLLLSLVEQIDAYQPDAVITFDHTGWYYHLDHVGVSIATTLAFQQSAHRPELFFHNHFRVDGSKWQYVFSEKMPVTHQVKIHQVMEVKFKAMDLHLSQDLNTPRNHMTARTNQFELFQLVSGSEKGKNWLANQEIFQLL